MLCGSPTDQVGDSFAVSFVEPGPLPQGMPPQMQVAYSFVAPSTDNYNFAMTAVASHFYPLTNGTSRPLIVALRIAAAFCSQPAYRPGAKLCIRAVSSPTTCIAAGTLDQINSGPRDGRWQPALTAVPLTFNQSYEFSVAWDPRRGGYVAVDALLVESQALYNGGAPLGNEVESKVVVGAMDSRIFVSTDIQ